ncbi:MAG: RNA polymerase subunit sigma-70 [Christensenellaceae bacterium]|jgi:RNA polymerase sigma factor (sigma-70 family)|nr:RNA polymerase subunit sigma-70 [Christensenellaceae bacterium]
MQYWKKTRNYRKHVDTDGSVRYVITVDGEEVEVTEAVYKAYSQADRRERYGYEREEGLLLSLERMDEEGVHPTFPTDRRVESAEDTVMRRLLIAEALDALSCLTPSEQRLIQAVVMEGVSEQEYAEYLGVSQVAVHLRKHGILKKIFQIMTY